MGRTRKERDTERNEQEFFAEIFKCLHYYLTPVDLRGNGKPDVAKLAYVVFFYKPPYLFFKKGEAGRWVKRSASIKNMLGLLRLT